MRYSRALLALLIAAALLGAAGAEAARSLPALVPAPQLEPPGFSATELLTSPAADTAGDRPFRLISLELFSFLTSSPCSMTNRAACTVRTTDLRTVHGEGYRLFLAWRPDLPQLEPIVSWKTASGDFDKLAGVNVWVSLELAGYLRRPTFQGLWTDPVTGLSYARNRWYDARTASWLSTDPLGAVDSQNLYAFVGWAPHMGRDPMGDCRLSSGGMYVGSTDPIPCGTSAYLYALDIFYGFGFVGEEFHKDQFAFERGLNSFGEGATDRVAGVYLDTADAGFWFLLASDEERNERTEQLIIQGLESTVNTAYTTTELLKKFDEDEATFIMTVGGSLYDEASTLLSGSPEEIGYSLGQKWPDFVVVAVGSEIFVLKFFPKTQTFQPIANAFDDMADTSRFSIHLMESSGRTPQQYVPDLSHVTGKAAAARNRAIQVILKEDFPNLRLTHTPEYNPFIRTGVALEGAGSQIGKSQFGSRSVLRDVIIHEELHHRWWSRGIFNHHPPGSKMETQFYAVIVRYKRMRGWDG